MALEVTLKLQKEEVVLVPRRVRPHFGRLLPRDPNRYCPDLAHCMQGAEIRLLSFWWLFVYGESRRKPGERQIHVLRSGIVPEG